MFTLASIKEDTKVLCPEYGVFLRMPALSRKKNLYMSFDRLLRKRILIDSEVVCSC